MRSNQNRRERRRGNWIAAEPQPPLPNGYGVARRSEVRDHNLNKETDMRKTDKLTVVVMTVLLGVGLDSTMAAEASAGVDVNSAYVWRGITLNDGVVVQPSVDVALPNGLGVNVWGNLDADDYDDTLQDGEFSEIDLTLSYGFSVGPLECGVGYIEYLFPHQGDTNGPLAGTREIYATAGLDLCGGLSAGLEIYYDVDEVEDFYAAASLTYGCEISDALSAEIGALAGYASEDASPGVDDGLHEYVFSLSTTYAATESLELGANIAYTDTFDEDVLPEQDVDVFGGVSIINSF